MKGNIQLPPDMTKEEFQKAFESFQFERKVGRKNKETKTHQVILISSYVTAPILLERLEASPVNYYDFEETRDSLKRCKEIGISSLEGEGQEPKWLFYVDAFTDMDALKLFCKNGLPSNKVFGEEPPYLGKVLENLMKVGYLERYNRWVSAQEYY